MDSYYAILNLDDKSAVNEVARSPKSSQKGGFSVFNNPDNIRFVGLRAESERFSGADLSSRSRGLTPPRSTPKSRGICQDFLILRVPDFSARKAIAKRWLVADFLYLDIPDKIGSNRVVDGHKLKI